jgi:hypothetical protein
VPRASGSAVQPRTSDLAQGISVGNKSRATTGGGQIALRESSLPASLPAVDLFIPLTLTATALLAIHLPIFIGNEI